MVSGSRSEDLHEKGHLEFGFVECIFFDKTDSKVTASGYEIASCTEDV